MYPGSLLYALPLLLIAALTGGLALHVFRRPEQPGAQVFGWLIAAMAEWAAAYALEFLAPTLSDKILAAKWQYLGIAAVPPLWLAFALRYTGRTRWLTRRNRILLAAPALLTFGLALTNKTHHLIWTGVSLDPAGFPGLLISGHGLGFWFHTLISYVFLLGGVGLYGLTLARAARVYRRQAGIMVIGSLVPLASNALYLSNLFPVRGLDATPFAFAISSVILAFGYFRFGLLDLMPVGTPAVFENISAAVIIVDTQNRVVELNRAARQWLSAGDDTIGRTVLDVLGSIEVMHRYLNANEVQTDLEIGENERRRLLELNISPLRDAQQQQLLGRVIVVRDITRERALLDVERRHARHMELLNAITRVAVETPDFHQMLQLLADRLGELIEADGCYIVLWDEANQQGIPAAAYGPQRETYARSGTRALPGEATMTVSVLHAGQALVVEDVFNTPYLSPRIAALSATRSLLALPLIAHSQKLGAALIGFDRPHHFTEDEITLGEQAAGQIALAVAKAQFYDAERRRAAQLAALQSVSQAVASSLQLGQVFETVVQVLHDTFNYHYVSIYRLDGEMLRLGAQVGYLTELIYWEVPITRGVSGRAVRTGQTQFIKDVTADPDFLRASYEVESEICVPLLKDQVVLGTLNVESALQSPLTEADVTLLTAFASQVVVAIDNASLFETERTERVLADALRQASLALSESLDFDTVLDRLLEEIERVVPYDAASVMLIEADTGFARITRSRGYDKLGPEVALQIVSLSFDITTTANLRQMAETRRPLIIPDIASDPAWVNIEAAAHLRSWAGAPILRQGQVVAFFSLNKTEPGFYRPEHAEHLEAFTGQAAVALENARLYAAKIDHARELEALLTANAALLSTLDLDPLLHNILTAAIAAIPAAEKGAILLIDATAGHLQIRAVAGYTDSRVKTFAFAGSGGYSFKALREKRPLLIPDARADPAIRYEGDIPEVRAILSAIVAPLMHHDEPLGVIALDATRRTAFTPADLRLLGAFANTAAIAIDHARLHSEIRALAETDSLTDLANRRAFDLALRREVDRAARYEYPLALLLLDIDSFKEYNDRYGHPAGDERLRAFARLLRDRVRDPDFVARYGGEEFAIILPHTNKAGAMTLSERIRAAAEAARPTASEGERMTSDDRPPPPDADHRSWIAGYTISIGVAVFPHDALTPEALLRAADDAELGAKRAGKNRVYAAQ